MDDEEIEDTQEKPGDAKNPHAAALSALGASKGGKARAKKLTPEQRAAIARQGAEVRWAKQGKQPMPRATHDGTLNIGNLDLSCAVLEDGTRVLSERSLALVLGAPRGGRSYAARKAPDGGAVLPIYLASEKVRPFISEELLAALFPPVEFVPLHGGRSAFGVRAEIVPAICDVWLLARQQGVLTDRQQMIAQKAEILMRGLAHVGIIALVDEATGYQDTRARDALAKILEAFIAKELRRWVSTFPPEFYKELFRLRGWRFPDLPEDQRKRPVLVGKLTNDIVYDRLAPGVRKELHRLTPRDGKGRLKQKLFQRLTEEIGHPKLREHLGIVTALMKAADDWDDFMRMINRSLPRYGDNLALPFNG